MKKYKIENNQIIEEIILKKASEADNFKYADGWRDSQFPEDYDPILHILGEQYFSESLDKVTWHLTSKELPALEDLKKQKINEIKLRTNQLLSETDWVVIRAQERAIEIPADIASQRLEILNKCTLIETEIQAFLSVEDLLRYTF